MPRKKLGKTAKMKKSANSRQTKGVASTLADTMEKSFREIPAKLIAQCRKELSTIKQQESKLKNELKKVQAQKKIAKNKQSTLLAKNKAKPTQTSRKQLTAAKQAHDKIEKTLSGLLSSLALVKKQVDSASKKQAKFIALSKQLSTFDKEWEKKGKKTKSTKSTKAKRTPAKKMEVEFTSTLRDLMKTPETNNTTPVPSTEITE